MAAIAGGVKDLFAFKYKHRDDDFSDQYSRIFMTKAMLVATFITGMQWYSDDVSCTVPANLAGRHVGKYSGEACWINGFYVYEELRHAFGCQGYFGIPLSTNHNGTARDDPCGTCVAVETDKRCLPMQKKFYIQYQWYPFFLAALSLFYYLPYGIFIIGSTDLKSLKIEAMKMEPDVEGIVVRYFSGGEEEKRKSRRAIVVNVVIKVSYIVVNVAVFMLCDVTLNGDFRYFGIRWIKWLKVENRNDYVSKRWFIDASELLLPSFGYCDVLEEWTDVIRAMQNEHKLICEISQHILYQYVLMALWYLMVTGVVLSTLSCIALILRCMCWGFFTLQHWNVPLHVRKKLTTRQSEYLSFLRSQNFIVYADVLGVMEKMSKQKELQPNGSFLD